MKFSSSANALVLVLAVFCWSWTQVIAEESGGTLRSVDRGVVMTQLATSSGSQSHEHHNSTSTHAPDHDHHNQSPIKTWEIAFFAVFAVIGSCAWYYLYVVVLRVENSMDSKSSAGASSPTLQEKLVMNVAPEQAIHQTQLTTLQPPASSTNSCAGQVV